MLKFLTTDVVPEDTFRRYLFREKKQINSIRNPGYLAADDERGAGRFEHSTRYMKVSNALMCRLVYSYADFTVSL
jgi:hypothetical protein